MPTRKLQFVVLSLEVTAVVFWPGKGLCTKLTLCSDLVLAKVVMTAIKIKVTGGKK